MPFDALFDTPKWEEAECAKIDDLDYFFPESKAEWRERMPQLLKLCGSCVHQFECLSYAIENNIEEGFWGNHTPEERARMTINKEDRRYRRIREVENLLSQGWSKEEAAKILGIKVASLERTLSRSKRKGDFE
jgi:transcriptional regulator with GAF, ATPase, and Fis domain